MFNTGYRKCCAASLYLQLPDYWHSYTQTHTYIYICMYALFAGDSFGRDIAVLENPLTCSVNVSVCVCYVWRPQQCCSSCRAVAVCNRKSGISCFRDWKLKLWPLPLATSGSHFVDTLSRPPLIPVACPGWGRRFVVFQLNSLN